MDGQEAKVLAVSCVCVEGAVKKRTLTIDLNVSRQHSFKIKTVNIVYNLYMVPWYFLVVKSA